MNFPGRLGAILPQLKRSIGRLQSTLCLRGCMKKSLGSLFLPLLVCLSHAQQGSPALGPALVLTHVTVIDMTGAAAKPDITVIITGARISQIARSGTIQVPQNAQVVEARG